MRRRRWRRRLSWIVTLPVALLMVGFVLLNRHETALVLLPGTVGFEPLALEMPLFLLVLAIFLAGFGLGGAVAWAAQRHNRRRARRRRRRAERAERADRQARAVPASGGPGKAGRARDRATPVGPGSAPALVPPPAGKHPG